MRAMTQTDRPEKKRQIPVTPSMARMLMDHRNRTGMSTLAFIHKHRDKLGEITPSDLNNWMDSFGPPIMIDPLDFDLVNEIWATESSIKQRNKPKRYDSKIQITDEMKDRLNSEITRTCVGSTLFYRQFRTEIPELSKTTIQSWAKGKVRSADPKLFEKVLNAYASLPSLHSQKEQTSIGHQINIRHARRPIGEDDLKLLRHYHRITNILPSRIFKGVKDKPQDLRESIVRDWLTGKTQSAIPGHVEWVKNRTRKLLEEALV